MDASVAPPDGTPVEYLGLPNCDTVLLPTGAVEQVIMAHLLRAQPGGPLHCGLDEGLHVAEQQQMAYESARSGRAIDLNTTFDLWWPGAPGLMDLAGDRS
jgi:hypothetical protein